MHMGSVHPACMHDDAMYSLDVAVRAARSVSNIYHWDIDVGISFRLRDQHVYSRTPQLHVSAEQASQLLRGEHMNHCLRKRTFGRLSGAFAERTKMHVATSIEAKGTCLAKSSLVTSATKAVMRSG